MTRRRGLPQITLRAARGQLVCLVHGRSNPCNQEDTRVLAFVASLRAPFLRRLTLYRFATPAPTGTDGTPRAAAA
jgi:hypothetical protein